MDEYGEGRKIEDFVEIIKGFGFTQGDVKKAVEELYEKGDEEIIELKKGERISVKVNDDIEHDWTINKINGDEITVSKEVDGETTKKKINKNELIKLQKEVLEFVRKRDEEYQKHLDDKEKKILEKIEPLFDSEEIPSAENKEEFYNFVKDRYNRFDKIRRDDDDLGLKYLDSVIKLFSTIPSYDDKVLTNRSDIDKRLKEINEERKIEIVKIPSESIKRFFQGIVNVANEIEGWNEEDSGEGENRGEITDEKLDSIIKNLDKDKFKSLWNVLAKMPQTSKISDIFGEGKLKKEAIKNMTDGEISFEDIEDLIVGNLMKVLRRVHGEVKGGKEDDKDNIEKNENESEKKIRESLEPLLSFDSEVHKIYPSIDAGKEGRNIFLNSDIGKEKMAEYATNYEALRSGVVEAIKSGDAKIVYSSLSNLEKGDILAIDGSIDNTTKEIYIFKEEEKDPTTKENRFYFYRLGKGKEFMPLVASEGNKVGKVEFVEKKENGEDKREFKLEELVKKHNEKSGDKSDRIGFLEEEINRKKEELIKNCESFEELDSVLDRIDKLSSIKPSYGLVKGEVKNYTIAEVKKDINRVRTGEIKSNGITRNLGLRDKVIELLAKEKSKK